MKMGSKENIEAIKPEGEIYHCPYCSYTDGFHVSFKMNKEQTGEIILICPNCHRRFLIGFKVDLSQK